MRLPHTEAVLARCRKNDKVYLEGKHWQVGYKRGKIVRLNRGKAVRHVTANTRVMVLANGRCA